MNELKILIQMGEFQIELNGNEDTVKNEFENLKKDGLGNIFDSVSKMSISKDPSKVQGNNKKSSAHKKKPTKRNNRNSKKSKSPNKSNFKIVPDLNLKPSGKESLTDFYSKYEIKSNFERNTIFLYYLENVISIEEINMDHIYTCYKAVKEKVPKIYQSLADTKNRKGWIDTSDMNNLKLTVHGENLIEHDINVKDNK